ncbi:hypothetical protein CFC21_021659 [Triticum aestivum]|uniref:Isopenicillin N synthase-like Fe(2+) 2OG dioxygenase domain-containing protein n=2 Tax=Triticum aestivum TaxID=4565 RepID=A0A9R1EB80_WHEAT|nr:hypothetical protein CFC21_021659 [Triticum aestivum]
MSLFCSSLKYAVADEHQVGLLGPNLHVLEVSPGLDVEHVPRRAVVGRRRQRLPHRREVAAPVLGHHQVRHADALVLLLPPPPVRRRHPCREPAAHGPVPLERLGHTSSCDSRVEGDVAAKLAASLVLEETDADRMFQDWSCQFRNNRYNYTPDTVGETGVQVHTDSGFLIVLQEDDRVSGLEVADPDTGEFAPVDPVPGTFLVNLGDVATVQMLTSSGLLRLPGLTSSLVCVSV